MFSANELNGIDSSYFRIIQTTSHKHHAESAWHLQCNRHTLRLALDEIKQHDDFHLLRKQLKQSRRFHSDRH